MSNIINIMNVFYDYYLYYSRQIDDKKAPIIRKGLYFYQCSIFNMLSGTDLPPALKLWRTERDPRQRRWNLSLYS